MAATQSRERSVVHDRLWEFFRDQKTRAGLLARRLLHREAPGDAALAEHLIRECRLKTRMNGSLDGALVPTAWGAWELLQLEAPMDNAGVVRMVGFILRQQDQPGRVFGEGCRPYLHERQWCSHYVGGFFSAGPTEQPIAPARFPTGAVVNEEQHARFAASCFALRTVIRAGEDRRDGVRRHVASLLDIPGIWSEWAGTWSPNLVFFALGAVALAPLDLRERAAQASAQVLARQQADGSWPGADLFHALDMLLLVPTAEAREAVRRAAPLACRLIQDGETLTEDGGAERGLVVLQALALTGAAS
ncbi:MAG: hypothetical protein HYW06_09460 [Gemmatimonadetes bacterium]|nr:hypothetical protein [Gemmatimonadota bacterium]